MSRRATLEELQASAHALRGRGMTLRLLPKLMEIADEQERRLLAVADWSGVRLALAPFALVSRFNSGRGRLRRYVRAAIGLSAGYHKVVATQRERFERVALDYIDRRMRATREVAKFRIYGRLLSPSRSLRSIRARARPAAIVPAPAGGHSPLP